jgi:ABC-type antimicrobial peptide transport system permease subunit
MTNIPFSYSLRNLWVRRLTALFTSLGMALVVFVFASSLMLAEGLRRTLVATGSANNVVVIRKGATTEVFSGIDRNQAAIVETQPEIALGRNGQALLSREVVVLINLPKVGSDKKSNVVIRGIGENSLILRPKVRLVEGRMLRPGTSDIIVGQSIARRFKGAGIGESLRIALRDWTVVGVFDAQATGFGSEIWADADQVMQAFRRPVYSSIIFRLMEGGKALSAMMEGNSSPAMMGGAASSLAEGTASPAMMEGDASATIKVKASPAMTEGAASSAGEGTASSAMEEGTVLSAMTEGDASAAPEVGRETSEFEKLKAHIESDPRLTLKVYRETEYYEEQSKWMAKFLTILGISLTLIFSLGAMIGAIITMYASVANRTREIGTLRALGFQRGSILGAFLFESLLLGFLGGCAGLFFASFLQLLTISTVNIQTFSELAFSFSLSFTIAYQALTFSLIMGLIGGVLPAFKASRMNIVEALRAS